MSTAPDHQQVRSWYGLPATIVVERGHWHLVRIGPVALPHPPLVNLLLRRGLPSDDRLRLSYWHEFGHLQTLPLALAHAVWLLRRRPARRVPRWQWFVIVLIAHEVAWELASESYVVIRAGCGYRRVYREHRNPLLAAFWVGTALLTLGGTALARRGATIGR